MSLRSLSSLLKLCERTLGLTLSTQQIYAALCPGDTLLFCKGADSSIFPRVRQEEVERIRMHVERNATVGDRANYTVPFSYNYFLLIELLCAIVPSVQEGYRTLCVAYKILSADEYAQADAQISDARLALHDREERLTAVYNQVENGMSLIGATAVEDRWVILFYLALSCILLFCYFTLQKDVEYKHQQENHG